jgi:hypothetical protein
MVEGPSPLSSTPFADQAMIADARANCAQRCNDRGATDLAASYLRGEQDLGWAMRHEVNRLRAEAAAEA